eukprot:gene23478-biopygen19344
MPFSVAIAVFLTVRTAPVPSRHVWVVAADPLAGSREVQAMVGWPHIHRCS